MAYCWSSLRGFQDQLVQGFVQNVKNACVYGDQQGIRYVIFTEDGLQAFQMSFGNGFNSPQVQRTGPGDAALYNMLKASQFKAGTGMFGNDYSVRNIMQA